MLRERTAALPDVHLTLCLTHDCNLRCSYCYAGAKRPRHMPRDVAERAIELALAKANDRLHLVFFGGEPMLRWTELVALTELAINRGREVGTEIRPTVTTNGTLLSEDRCAWLAGHGFVLAVSCDGVQEAHDANRVAGDAQGSHASTWRGLERALASGAKVRVILVLHPRNVHLLPASVDALVAAGADDLVVNPDWSADWSAPELQAAWTEAYERVAERYVHGYREGRPFWISILDPKIAAYIKGGYGEADRCDLGRRNLVVAPSGNLYPCDRMVADDSDPTRVIGHVDTGPNAAAVSRFAGPRIDLPVDCLGCGVRSRCRNFCACANLAMTGDASVPAPLLCFHEQLCVRTADDAAEVLFAEENELFVRRHYGSEIVLGRPGPEPT